MVTRAWLGLGTPCHFCRQTGHCRFLDALYQLAKHSSQYECPHVSETGFLRMSRQQLHVRLSFRRLFANEKLQAASEVIVVSLNRPFAKSEFFDNLVERLGLSALDPSIESLSKSSDGSSRTIIFAAKYTTFEI